jgi:hypothetical protein
MTIASAFRAKSHRQNRSPTRNQIWLIIFDSLNRCTDSVILQHAATIAVFVLSAFMHGPHAYHESLIQTLVFTDTQNITEAFSASTLRLNTTLNHSTSGHARGTPTNKAKKTGHTTTGKQNPP